MHNTMRDVLESADLEWQNAIDEGRLVDALKTDEPHDVIHEIADSCVPIYNADLLQIACDDFEIATAEPESGPAFDGTPTPLNIIAANVYEAIEAHLWEKWNTFKAETEDAAMENTVPA